MNSNLQKSLTEVKYVLKHLPKDEKNKIPVQLRRLITEHHDTTHIVDLNNLSKRTHALLAIINRKYLAENKAELESEHKASLKKENLLKAKTNLNQSHKIVKHITSQSQQ